MTTAERIQTYLAASTPEQIRALHLAAAKRGQTFDEYVLGLVKPFNWTNVRARRR